VPLIFSGPGIPKNNIQDTMCYLLDIFPTLCDLSNIDTPDSVEGKSLAKCFGSPKENIQIRDELYFAYSFFQRAVKSEGCKLVEYVGENGYLGGRLYNLNEDPLEINNYYDDSKYAEIKNRLTSKMNNLADKWDDRKTEFGKFFWKRMDEK
jgi:arylsulfatase A-like enzyme